jgi:hypothetical protein
VSCRKWVIGGGFCPNHLELDLTHPNEDIAHIAATCTYLNGEPIAL